MLGCIIEGERVRLVPTALEMLPTFVLWLADRRITRYLGRGFVPSQSQEQEWFEKMSRSESDVIWAIMVGERLIGAIGIHEINWLHRRAVTGIMIGEMDEWGKGYASEAMRLRTRYAFAELGLEKMVSEVLVDNIASRRALEKAGYVQYGIARRHIFRENRWQDMWLGEVLREEWEARFGDMSATAPQL